MVRRLLLDTTPAPHRNPSPLANPPPLREHLAAADEILAQLTDIHDAHCPVFIWGRAQTDYKRPLNEFKCNCEVRPNREDVEAWVDYCTAALLSAPEVARPLVEGEWGFHHEDYYTTLSLSNGKVEVHVGNRASFMRDRIQEPLWITSRNVQTLNKAKPRGLKTIERALAKGQQTRHSDEELYAMRNASPGLGDEVANDLMASGEWTYPTSAREGTKKDALVFRHRGRNNTFQYVGPNGARPHPGVEPGLEGWWLPDAFAARFGFATRYEILGIRKKQPSQAFRVGDRVRYSSADEPEAIPASWRGRITGLEPNLRPHWYYTVHWTRPDGDTREGHYHQDDLIDEAAAAAATATTATTATAWEVIWDNGHASGVLGSYATEQEANDAGLDWYHEMMAATPGAEEDDYSFEVHEVEDD